MSENTERKEKFTPGPWIVKTCDSGESCWCRTIVSHNPDCDGDAPDDNEYYTIISSGSLRERNAALIAAAPDMYEALETAILEYGKPGGPWNVPSEPGTWIDKAKSALAKARGES